MHEARSCDTAVAVGSATANGSVVFAKNSDRRANEAQPRHYAPRRRHHPALRGSVAFAPAEIPRCARNDIDSARHDRRRARLRNDEPS